MHENDRKRTFSPGGPIGPCGPGRPCTTENRQQTSSFVAMAAGRGGDRGIGVW